MQRRTAAQAVSERVLGMIRDGTLAPGDQLPTEREIAERLAVGRSSVREALQILATLNVVEARPGSGTFVRRPRLGDILKPETLALLAANTRAMELLEAREMIEPPLARLAAIRATAEDFSGIEGLLGRHAAAVARGQPVREHAARFHVLVARASHNGVAAAFMEPILGLLNARGRRTDGNREYAEVELAEHGAILEILRRRDPDAAGVAMREHILRAAATYDLGGAPDLPDDNGGRP